ncbi:MAG: hypothetical protein F2789_12660 [Actinobacteria bacterium]|nr:hypothetical protein [Actinomycetota bacterium]
MLGVRIECGDQVRIVGTIVGGRDAIHPGDFRDLVGLAIQVDSLEPLRRVLNLPSWVPIDVSLIPTEPSCLVRPGGVVRSVARRGSVYLFATDLRWQFTLSLLLDSTASMRAAMSPVSGAEPFLEAMHAAEVDSLYDEVVAITVVTVRNRLDAAPSTDATIERLCRDISERLEGVFGGDDSTVGSARSGG